MSDKINKNNTNLETFDGERGIPNVNDHTSSIAKRGFIVLAIFLLIVLSIFSIYWKYKQTTHKEAEKARETEITSSVPERTFTDAEKQDGKKKESIDQEKQGPSLPDDSKDVVNFLSDPVIDKSESDLMVIAKNEATKKNVDGDLYKTSQMKNNNLSALLSSTQTSKNIAHHLGNRNFILAKSSFIDCALQTKLDSTVPGLTSCVVTHNIYSDNGKVMLIERGSTIGGEYQSNMRQGMARIYVLWSRIKTPNGITINMDSPGTDPLGASGLPGYIDNHFWKRFGGAFMLSLVDDVAHGITNSIGSNNNQQNFTFNTMGNTTQNMATEALRNTINIPPTLYKNQGDQIGIYVARDLDFSSVYNVTIKK